LAFILGYGYIYSFFFLAFIKASPIKVTSLIILPKTEQKKQWS